MPIIQELKKLAQTARQEAYTLVFAIKDKRTPWPAKLLALVVVGYTLSPIDLIPDFIPFFGWLDDALVVSLGVWLVLKLIPPEVVQEAREKSKLWKGRFRKIFWISAVVMILIWLFIFWLIFNIIHKHVR